MRRLDPAAVLGATIIATIFAVGMTIAPDVLPETAVTPSTAPPPTPTETSAPTPPSTVPDAVTANTAAVGAATVTSRAVRLPERITVPSTTIEGPVDGDCDSWRHLFDRYGLPWDQFHRIAWRESNCSHAIADRPSTGDLSAGIVQVNFYGYLNDMWEDAGWSWPMVRDDPEAAVAAAGALHRMCGGLGPWTPPYSCRGNELPSPGEMGYTS